MSPVCTAFRNHVCFSDYCLTCEFGFALEMMSIESEQPTQVGNLWRTLKALPEAYDHDLFNAQPQHERTSAFASMVPKWFDFIMSYTSAELGSEDDTLSKAMRWNTWQTTTYSCGHGKSHGKNMFVMPLQYWDHYIPNLAAIQDLHPFLRESINAAIGSEYCGKCRSHQTAHITRRFDTLPSVLCLSFALDEQANVTCMRRILNVWMSKTANDAKSGAPLIPAAIWTRIGADGVVNMVSTCPLAKKNWDAYEAKVVVYELAGNGNCSRTVAVVKSNRSWHVIDNESTMEVSASDALNFDLKERIPCVVFYGRTDADNHISVPNPISREVFMEYSRMSANGHTPQSSRHHEAVVPLQADETIGPEMMVALDAEFVALTKNDAESSSKSSLMAGRVTVLRGNGPHVGKVLMDEYVVAPEEVEDHLTEFSGIMPGDLCVHLSSKRLHTFKSVYVRLRHLIDNGVVFCGHGLCNDFRVMNIKVPAKQVVDTVQLFRLPDQRLISLKFLAWFFLGAHVQIQCHDSIEDARTALQLYEKYQILSKSASSFLDLLNQMYDVGRSLQWKVPPSQ